MSVKNACRAYKTGEITPENLSPVPKNPLIASFFRVGDRVGGKVGDRVGDNACYYLTENQHRIISCLKENPEMSAAGLAKSIGISSRKVEDNIQKLKKLGMLQRHGSPRKGYWVVKNG